MCDCRLRSISMTYDDAVSMVATQTNYFLSLHQHKRKSMKKFQVLIDVTLYRATYLENVELVNMTFPRKA